MDFGKVLSTLSKRLEAAEIDWVVVGGLALALYGLPRTTLDIDVMVDGNQQETVLSISQASALTASTLLPATPTTDIAKRAGDKSMFFTCVATRDVEFCRRHGGWLVRAVWRFRSQTRSTSSR